jgi:hypothetical protein
MKRLPLLCALVAFALLGTVHSAAQELGDWRAASSTAKTITGDVAFSREKLWINFAPYWIAQIRTLTPDELTAAFPAESSAGGTANLYRLSIPADKKFLRKNTLCGSDDTQWVAAYATGNNLQLAFFSGSHIPTLTPDALANSATLCGIFSYVK